MKTEYLPFADKFASGNSDFWWPGFIGWPFSICLVGCWFMLVHWIFTHQFPVLQTRSWDRGAPKWVTLRRKKTWSCRRQGNGDNNGDLRLRESFQQKWGNLYPRNWDNLWCLNSQIVDGGRIGSHVRNNYLTTVATDTAMGCFILHEFQRQGWSK